jgi:hypothetical protein
MLTFLEKVVKVTRPYFRISPASNSSSSSPNTSPDSTSLRSSGPVILLQIENEYGWLEEYNGEAGKEYAGWCVRISQELVPELPWWV